MIRHTKIFVFFILVYSHLAISQESFLLFNKIKSQNEIFKTGTHDIFRDSKGFIWIGNEFGLHRYDGYTVISFTHNADTNSLGCDQVNAICEDQEGNLWIGTNHGIDKFLIAERKFLHIINEKDIHVNKIAFDKEENLWIGSYKGFSVYNKRKNLYKAFIPDSTNPNAILPGGIKEFTFDDDENIWMSIWNYGLSKFDKVKEVFVHYNHDPNDTTTIFKSPVFSVCKDNNNGIWVASFNESKVSRFDIKTGRFTHFYPQRKDEAFKCFSISKDLFGNLWFATMEGLYEFDMEAESFSSYYHIKGDNNSLSESRMAKIYCDYTGTIWIGTMNNGINYAHVTNKNLKLYQSRIKSDHGKYTLLEDFGKNIWLINNAKDYFILNKKSFLFESFLNVNLLTAQSGNYSIAKNLIISIFSPDSIVVDITNKSYKIYSIKNNLINKINYNQDMIINDRFYKVWKRNDTMFFLKTGSPTPHATIVRQFMYGYRVGAIETENFNGRAGYLIYYGRNLIFLDKYSGKFEYVLKELNHDYMNANISHIFFNGDIIEIVLSNDLIKYNYKKKSLSRSKIWFLNKNDIVAKVFRIGNERYIFGTYRGIFFSDFAKKIVQHPYIFSNDIINPDNIIYTSDKKIMMEVPRGIVEFDPDQFFNFSTNNQFSITDFYLFNRQVEVGKNSVLKKDPTRLSSITLSHKENIFSFEFSLLNYSADNNEYMYMLEGYEESWNYIGPRKVATYTNLPPGTYYFKARGKGENTQWSNTAVVEVVITPAFWQTWWFKLLIFLLVVVIVYSFFYLRLKIIKRQKEELELKVLKRTEEISLKNKELSAQKDEIQAQNEEILSQNEEIVAQRDEIMARNEEILAQKEELYLQKEKISELYQELTDNIITAERIQKSILPDLNLIKQQIPDIFIFYSPKDIVSGDFYWFYSKYGKNYLAAVDCTGHGVSGAFMSLIGRTLLNQIISENPTFNAGEILTKLSKELTITLRQDKEDAITKDGMDIALVIIDKEEDTLDFAGANNSLFMVQNGEIEIVSADKKGIGLQRGNVEATFTNQILPIKSGVEYYIFSDGFIGQFGGEAGDEKFKMTRFKETLLQMQGMEYNYRREFLFDILNSWKKDNPQTDDILVIGFKI